MAAVELTMTMIQNLFKVVLIGN
ncbi:hypothetical protein CCACVL1_23251 [Corchorus capsularis]|uniref:Uncharacterized protein n=1 Tax=Corchorus capsularis TaxID=210143 RepID=A0A1R3GUW0_COCAP|nr:hypothetical protein CCACVL1_23251 [Corchorus capsularis]